MKHQNPIISLQVLPTGHLAPASDEDIAGNNVRFKSFPHIPITQYPAIRDIPAWSTVIDVGAFIGDNTLEFTKKGWKVIAFEPFYDAWICAVINAPDARIINAPVGDGRRVRLIHQCPGTNHGMRCVTPADEGVQTVMLDSLDIRDCAFIKIDAEGFEPFVLDGAQSLIKTYRPVMFIEANTEALARQGWTPEKLREKIVGLGYRTEVIGEPPNWDWICTPL